MSDTERPRGVNGFLVKLGAVVVSAVVLGVMSWGANSLQKQADATAALAREVAEFRGEQRGANTELRSSLQALRERVARLEAGK